MSALDWVVATTVLVPFLAWCFASYRAMNSFPDDEADGA